jgi:hypothetical protein
MCTLVGMFVVCVALPCAHKLACLLFRRHCHVKTSCALKLACFGESAWSPIDTKSKNCDSVVSHRHCKAALNYLVRVRVRVRVRAGYVTRRYMDFLGAFLVAGMCNVSPLFSCFTSIYSSLHTPSISPIPVSLSAICSSLSTVSSLQQVQDVAPCLVCLKPNGVHGHHS